MQLILVVLLLVQLCLMNYKAFAQRSQYINETAMTKPGCPYRCSGGNNVTIPYPFGIGAKCALDETFVLTCNASFHPPRPYISGIGLQVLEISVEDAWVKVEKPLLTSINWNLSSNSSKFSETYGDNMLDWTISGNCSQQIDENRMTYYTNVDECTRPESNYCTEGCVNTPGAFKCVFLTPHKKLRIAMTGVGSGFGAISFVLGLWSIYKVIKRRNKSKLKKKFFKRNGGLLLQKQLSSGGEGNVEICKLFTSKDLEKATDNYSKNRILGQGGQEVASALSYLHSAASQPIYHRDIKSTNILLDEKYKAQVADFGTSRTIAIDQTHLTTGVSRTFGYLDPEYFLTSQFTEKSDVYSFGVVLVELLTGQKPISSTRSEEMRSLTTYFMVASKENHLFDILDARIQKEGVKEEITKVANLARRCLNSSGRKRPTMTEVTLELEGSRIPNGASFVNELDEEDGYDIIELAGHSETCSTSTACVNSHYLSFE
ncbi:hypothetical protein LguiB_006035 [Lonicera macranthoides]